MAGGKKRVSTNNPSSVPSKQDESVTYGIMDSQDDSDQANRPRKRRRVDTHTPNEENVVVNSQNQGLTRSPQCSGSPTAQSNRGGEAGISQTGIRPLPGDVSPSLKLAPNREDEDKIPAGQLRTLKPLTGTSKRKDVDPKESELASIRTVPKSQFESKTSSHLTSGSPASEEPIKESLNPRMIPNPPATHTIRFKLLSLLHLYISKLNDQTKLLNDPSTASIIMSPQQVITLCLTIEEHIARENVTVYDNVVKQRIMKYKKMTLEEWRMERFTRKPRPNAVPIINPIPAPRIETGLSSSQELAFLSRIHANLPLLSLFNYVTSAPTQEEMDAAARGVEAAHGWEVCDRCETRFQVFPGRRPEDGVRTTGGRCYFHPGKRCRLARGDYGYSCCAEVQGTKGCQAMATHVFKVSDPKRLAAIMPFMETPENPTPLSQEAVAFDCEMGYTTLGLELIRLTAISWPTGNQLIDVLVRPLGEILDFNSRFSGVWPKEYADAVGSSRTPSTGNEAKPGGANQVPPKFVESPAEARALLFTFISPRTPLIGHALENDLKAIRIIHPCIVDTVDLFPHSQGLPKRNSLKMLSSMLLDRDIQSGFRGHDSHDDARAAGDLVKVKIREVVKKWRAKGYRVGDGEFPPEGGDVDHPPRKTR